MGQKADVKKFSQALNRRDGMPVDITLKTL
jgi:hypothetical protein